MIYFLYLLLLIIIYNYIDFCYIKHIVKQKSSSGNNVIRLGHKNPPKFIIYIFILWSLIVLYMIYFSYKEAIVAGYPKTSIMILIGVVLIWSMPIYVKLFNLYKE